MREPYVYVRRHNTVGSDAPRVDIWQSGAFSNSIISKFLSHSEHILFAADKTM